MENFFLELTIILVAASLLSILFRFIKQPTILAYIVTGIIVAQLALLTSDGKVSIEALSKIGITLLLFVLGLEFKISELRSVGKVALLTGLGQIFLTTLAGLLLCTLLGFDITSSIYIAFGITFSSTIVIVKLLADKRDLTSLHGKITIGFLLVQDFFAILALIFLSGFSNGQTPGFDVLMVSLIKIIFLVVITLVFSQYIFPRLTHFLSQSNEILFISSLAWAFGMASLVSSPTIGFSIEIGGFLAGLALANSTESTQIISKVKSLRDFFILLFFVVLGFHLDFSNIGEVIVPAIIISIFVLIAKPIIVMSLLGLLGYKKRTSFLSGVSIAQISEFSLILTFLGQKLGHIDGKVVSLITLTGIITFTLSTYLIVNGDFIFDRIKPLLSVFEKKNNSKESFGDISEMSNHVILIGADRMGLHTLKALEEQKDEVLAIDFNPDIIHSLKADGYNVLFGDAADEEILEKANAIHARIILSSVPDFEDNLILIHYIKKEAKENPPLLLVTAHSEEDRYDLKKAGADYVIMPYKAAGKYIGKMIKNNEIDNLL